MKIKFNQKNIKLIEKNAQESLIETAEAVKTDLIQSQTMPFGKEKYEFVYGKRGKYKKNGEQYKGKKKLKYSGGTLQNDSTFVDDKEAKKGKVYIISDTPYARRLYFHPEYNFNKEKNKNAQGRWFDIYVSGEKREYVKKFFAKFYKRRLK